MYEEELEAVIRNISIFLAKKGVTDLHIFSSGTVVDGFVVQNVLSNRFKVHIYYWTGTRYVYLRQLTKGTTVKSKQGERN